MSITEKNGLKINTKLLDFVNNEIIPGTNIKSEEFWTNFKRLLNEAIKMGIYKKEDYSNKPKEYCGIKVTDSPLDN